MALLCFLVFSGTKKAIQLNIAIMRAFIELRKWVQTNERLIQRVDQIELKQNKQQDKLDLIFRAIEELNQEENDAEAPIGFDLPGVN